MTIPVNIESSSPESKKRGTQLWVKIVWILAALSLTWAGTLGFMSVPIDVGDRAPSLSCGTGWTPDDAEAVAWGDSWAKANRAEAQRNKISMPDMGKLIESDCIRLIDGRHSAMSRFIWISLTLGIVGLVGRMRPAIPVRIKR